MSTISKFILKLIGHTCPIEKTHFDNKVIEFAFKEIKENSVMLVGDSITEGWASVPELISNEIINFGIAGDTSIGVLKRINQIVNAKPKTILFNIGTNDIGANLDLTLIQNLTLILDKIKIKLPNTNIIICSIRFTSDAQRNIKTANYNVLFEQICREKKCKYVDLNFALAPKGIIELAYTSDGLHLSRKGYEAEYEIIKSYLN